MRLEERIVEGVREAFPGCVTISEEGPRDPSRLDASLCFVIDPIDGTAEFLMGDASFSISVAAVCQRHVEVGIVDFPGRNTRYEARRGEGAWRSGVRLVVRERTALAGASIAVTPRQRVNPALRTVFGRLTACDLVDIRPITAKLAAIASGDVEAALYLAHPGSEVAVWDYAAAGLLLEEAGGRLIGISDRHPILDRLPMTHATGWIASGRSLEQPLLAIVDNEPA